MSTTMLTRFTLILSLLSLALPSHGQDFDLDPVDSSSANPYANITPTTTTHQYLSFNPEFPLQRVDPVPFIAPSAPPTSMEGPVKGSREGPLMLWGKKVGGKKVEESEADKKLTNAERLAKGLNVAPPRWAQKRSEPEKRWNWPSSLPKVTVKGHVYCQSVEGRVLGWLRPLWNDLGEYGVFSPDKITYPLLEVEICYEPITGPWVVKEQLDLKTPNAPDLPTEAYDFVGGITGDAAPDSNIGVGSYGYGYIGGTVQTPPGSVPVEALNSFTRATQKPRTIESAIWTYLPATKELGLQWVNTSGLKQETLLLYIGDTLVYTGDLAKFIATFGQNPEPLKCYIDTF